MYWLRHPNSQPETGRCLTGYSLTAAIGSFAFALTQAAIPLAIVSVRVLPALASEACPAAMSQFQRHTVTANETTASIAAAYNLLPETLVQFNPSLGDALDAPLSNGLEITVPPFNGQVASVNAGDSWQSLAERHGHRADLLFEVNGCVNELPSRIFVPGARPITTTASRSAILQLPGYPLSQTANIATSYGWQPHPSRDELVFNGGLAFVVPRPMTVQSVGAGTVAFIGEREGYGRLLVINHEQGLQTRYANLSDVSVSVGQSVAASTAVGTVGSELGSSPSYLYFEVRTNSANGWIAQDPGKYLPALELR